MGPWGPGCGPGGSLAVDLRPRDSRSAAGSLGVGERWTAQSLPPWGRGGGGGGGGGWKQLQLLLFVRRGACNNPFAGRGKPGDPEAAPHSSAGRWVRRSAPLWDGASAFSVRTGRGSSLRKKAWILPWDCRWCLCYFSKNMWRYPWRTEGGFCLHSCSVNSANAGH